MKKVPLADPPQLNDETNSLGPFPPPLPPRRTSSSAPSRQSFAAGEHVMKTTTSSSTMDRKGSINDTTSVPRPVEKIFHATQDAVMEAATHFLSDKNNLISCTIVYVWPKSCVQATVQDTVSQLCSEQPAQEVALVSGALNERVRPCILAVVCCKMESHSAPGILLVNNTVPPVLHAAFSLTSKTRISLVESLGCSVPLLIIANCKESVIIETRGMAALAAVKNDIQRVISLQTGSPADFLDSFRKYFSEEKQEILNPFMNQGLTAPSALSAGEFDSEDSIDIESFKQDWIAAEMDKLHGQYTSLKDLRVWVGSYNVNGQTPSELLSNWLDWDVNPDVVVVGLQEVDAGASAIFFGSTDTNQNAWLSGISEFLAQRAPYSLIAQCRLVGMVILAYARNIHLPFVGDASCVQIGCGLLGVGGNKGAVGVRFKLHSSYLCILNAHMAAFESEIDRRNRDYQDICQRSVFRYKVGAAFREVGLFQSDFLIWIGDLNYRLSLSDALVRNYLRKRDIQSLLAYDQLNQARRDGTAFREFEEGEISFMPTFKFDPGTDRYDTSDKMRTPAWCDRILWRKGDPVTQLTYSSHLRMRCSDHKPVSSVFLLKIKMEDRARKEDLYRSLLLQIDRFENLCIPEVKVPNPHISFPVLRYHKCSKGNFTVENSGKAPAKFRISSRADVARSLTIHPNEGFLTPGDTATVDLSLMVDSSNVGEYHSNPQREFILIVHAHNGGDCFVSVSMTYIRSALFGVPMSELPLTPESVPVALQNILNVLNSIRLTNIENIGQVELSPNLVTDIRQCLDQGNDISSLASSWISPSIEQFAAVLRVTEEWLWTIDPPILSLTQFYDLLNAFPSLDTAMTRNINTKASFPPDSSRFSNYNNSTPSTASKATVAALYSMGLQIGLPPLNMVVLCALLHFWRQYLSMTPPHLPPRRASGSSSSSNNSSSASSAGTDQKSAVPSNFSDNARLTQLRANIISSILSPALIRDKQGDSVPARLEEKRIRFFANYIVQ